MTEQTSLNMATLDLREQYRHAQTIRAQAMATGFRAFRAALANIVFGGGAVVAR